MLRRSNGSHVIRVGVEGAQFAETCHFHLIYRLIRIKLFMGGGGGEGVVDWEGVGVKDT